MPRIFISYRRRDNPYVAAMLRDSLQEHFGKESVFFDLDNIPFGVDFRQYIADAVGTCDAILVMIGDQWLRLADEQGKPRLENPSDFVRIEIETALKRNIPLVPVLVEDARMPQPADLPESIRDMAFRNAAEVRAGRDQKHQVERLISGLAESVKAKIARLEKHDGALEAQARTEVAKSKKDKAEQVEKAPPEIVPLAETTELSPSEKKERAAFLKKARKAFEGITNPALHFAGAIPPDKANGAIQAYAQQISRDAIMLMYDSSLFGGAKSGVILTVEAVYFHNLWGIQGQYRYADIRAAALTASDNLLINNEKEVVLITPITRALFRLLLELRPELRTAQDYTEENEPKDSANASAEETAFLEKARQAFPGVTSHIWLKGEIPVAKARAATESYAPRVSVDDVLLLYDNTAFGSSKNGLVLTLDSIYWRNLLGHPERCRYRDLKTVSVKGYDVSINDEKTISMSLVGNEVAGRFASFLRTLIPQ